MGIINLSQFSPQGQVTTSVLQDGVFSADGPGRAKMATGFFDRTTLDRFAASAFPADAFGRTKFAPGFVDARLLADEVLAASVVGRKKMADGFLTPAKLKLSGETWDFTNAVALRAKAPTSNSEVATKAYVDAISFGVSTRLRYRVVDPTADAVPGQVNTYYIDRGITDLGYNVELDPQGLADIDVTINGRERLLVAEADLGNPAIPGDYAVVRSQSSGPEGPAAVGSRNALKLAFPLSGTVWLHYRRKDLAVP